MAKVIVFRGKQLWCLFLYPPPVDLFVCKRNKLKDLYLYSDCRFSVSNCIYTGVNVKHRHWCNRISYTSAVVVVRISGTKAEVQYILYIISRQHTKLKTLKTRYTLHYRMVLVLGGVVLDEAPIDSRNLYHAAPHLKEAAAHVASLPPKVVSPIGLLYLHQREYAVTLPHDSKQHVLHISSACGSDSNCVSCLFPPCVVLNSCPTHCSNKKCLLSPSSLLAIQIDWSVSDFLQAENVSLLGTDDCSTCVTVILRHTGKSLIRSHPEDWFIGLFRVKE